MKATEGATVIGKSVVIRGQVSGSEDMYMDGEVEGTILLHDSRLTVGPNARVKAEIHVRDAVVFGRIEGDVRASGRIEMRQSAAIIGNLFAARLSVEENAVIQGRVELNHSSTSAGSSSSTGSAAPQTTGSPLFVEEKA